HAGHLARAGHLRSHALHRRGAAQPSPLCLGAVRRRRAYVPWPALCAYAGEDLCPALPAKSRSVDRARLSAAMADVADPQAARRIAGDSEACLVHVLIAGLDPAYRFPCSPEIRPMLAGCPSYQPYIGTDIP